MSTAVQLLCKIFQICNNNFLHNVLEYLNNNFTVVLMLVTCLLVVVNFREWRAGHSVIGSFWKFAFQLKILKKNMHREFGFISYWKQTNFQLKCKFEKRPNNRVTCLSFPVINYDKQARDQHEHNCAIIVQNISNLQFQISSWYSWIFAL